MQIVRDPSQIIQEQQKILQQIARLARSEWGLSSLVDFVHRYEQAQPAGPQRKPSAREKKHSQTTAGLEAAFLKLRSFFTAPFHYRDVMEKLEREGYPFDQKNPKDAVSKMLRKLRDRKVLLEVKKGKGSGPITFKFAA